MYYFIFCFPDLILHLSYWNLKDTIVDLRSDLFYFEFNFCFGHSHITRYVCKIEISFFHKTKQKNLKPDCNNNHFVVARPGRKPIVHSRNGGSCMKKHTNSMSKNLDNELKGRLENGSIQKSSSTPKNS